MKDIRLHLIVEGLTEKRFVRDVLAGHLGMFHVFTDARSVYTSRDGAYWRRGGMTTYQRAKQDILLWMKEEKLNPDARFSTMFDLYAIPRDFPEYAEAKHVGNPFERVRIMEEALAHDIQHPGFLPYIQLHEYEALILSAPERFESYYGGNDHRNGILHLAEMVSRYSSPEEIDDGETTAPSKRIILEIPAYEDEKAHAGPLIAENVGVPLMRQRCPHFGAWLSRLENLAGGDSQ